MAYQVLARKYRPQTFDEVIGQEPVVRALTNALRQDRTAHAYLFSGIRGVGKTTTARLLAKALNCDEGPTPEPCGSCDSCEEVPTGSSLDVIEIDAATYTKVENMREVLDKTRYAPARDPHKVYIVDEVHMLSASAFNALLKTLEEPPRHVVFILATTELRKVPATIVSRCQHFEFRPVPHATLVEHLTDLCAREEAELSAGARSLVARRAAGSVRDAQSLMDLVLCYGGEEIAEADAARILGIADSRALSGLVEAIHEGQAAEALGRLEELLEGGADPVQLHAGLVEHVRNLMMARILEEPGKILPADDEEIQAWKELAERFREAELLRLLRLLAGGEAEVRHAAQPRYLLEGLLVRCCMLDRLSDLEEILRAVEAGAGPEGEPSGSAPSKRAGAGRGREGGAPSDGPAREQAPPAPSAGPPSTSSTTRPRPTRTEEGSLAARLAEACTKASLRRCLEKVQVELAEGALVVTVPANRRGLKVQLEGKRQQASLLEAARSILDQPVQRVELRESEADEPPMPAGGGAPADAAPKESGGPSDEEVESLIEDAPAFKTLLEVFQGEVDEIRDEDEQGPAPEG